MGTEAKSVAVEADVVRLPQGAEPSRALAARGAGTALVHAVIRGGALYASDSAKAVRLPLEGAGEHAEGAVPRNALERAERCSAALTLGEGTCQVGDEIQVRREAVGHPDWESLFDSARPQAGEEVVEVTVDPEQLGELARALGSEGSVTLRLRKGALAEAGDGTLAATRAVHVLGADRDRGEGLVMPLARGR